MRKIYRYVGPRKIAERSLHAPPGVPVKGPADIHCWIRQSGQVLDEAGSVTATFVVDDLGSLRIADRRSEHVACAAGRAVQSAGEMTFTVTGQKVEVSGVTNQSTGYCPEPDSWPAVQAALNRAGIDAPGGFSQEFVFRRCPRCGAINIVKDGVFECGVCSAPLPGE